MQIKSGKARIVLLLPRLGVAVKFPRISILRVLKYLWSLRKKNTLKHSLWFFTAPVTTWGGLRHSLFAGIVQNRSEYRFYRDTQNAFAWPTTFSLWGLVNVQPLGVLPPQKRERDIWMDVVNIAGADLEDMHCFAYHGNYCLDAQGSLYLLDYASENSQVVLRLYGEQLRSHFEEGP